MCLDFPAFGSRKETGAQLVFDKLRTEVKVQLDTSPREQ